MKNHADQTKEDLQRLRRKVAFDRFLARTFNNSEELRFLLKGGYSMELRFNMARATRDLDLTYLKRFKEHQKEDLPELIYQELRDISQNDMNDFFVFHIGEAEMDLENAPYGGARYPASSTIDGRLFVRFQIDVGLDIMANQIDKVKGVDWLDFCNIPSPVMLMISKEQQFAEKIHAYTLPRGNRINSRIKDLVDLQLFF